MVELTGSSILGLFRVSRHINHCWLFNAKSCLYIYIYIYVYIYSHPQADYFIVSQLFSVATHAGRFKLGSKPAQHYVRLSILQLSPGDIRYFGNYNALCISFWFVYILPFRILKCPVHSKSFALREWQPLISSPECSTPYIYIYIYMVVCVCVCVYGDNKNVFTSTRVSLWYDFK